MSDHKQSKKDDLSLETVFGALIITGSIFGCKAGYTRYFKQYKSVKDIPSNVFKHRWLYGKVTAVGDGDNFRFFHMPGGLLGGWGSFRTIPRLERVDIDSTNQAKSSKKHNKSKISSINYIFRRRDKNIKEISEYYLDLKSPYKGKRNLPTLSIRLSGTDAPERAHFGGKTQPFGDEALNWLRYTILGKQVWVKPLSIDQYNRCVARAVYWSWFGGWKDISLEMIKEGLSVVYEAKTGAEFDGRESRYRFQEFVTKSRKKGLWIQKKIETPGQYKKRLKQ